jgi:hypothetical protein
MQLTALSIIGPVVAITTVVDASELTTLVKEMIGVGLITAMQIIFLNAIFAFACYITDNPTYAISGIQISGLIAPFLLIGMLGAVERLPRWIERYTLVPTTLASGSGIARMGSIAIGVAARNIIGKVVR